MRSVVKLADGSYSAENSFGAVIVIPANVDISTAIAAHFANDPVEIVPPKKMGILLQTLVQKGVLTAAQALAVSTGDE